MVHEILENCRVFAPCTAEQQVSMIQKVLLAKYAPHLTLILIATIVFAAGLQRKSDK